MKDLDNNELIKHIGAVFTCVIIIFGAFSTMLFGFASAFFDNDQDNLNDEDETSNFFIHSQRNLGATGEVTVQNPYDWDEVELIVYTWGTGLWKFKTHIEVTQNTEVKITVEGGTPEYDEFSVPPEDNEFITTLSQGTHTITLTVLQGEAECGTLTIMRTLLVDDGDTDDDGIQDGDEVEIDGENIIYYSYPLNPDSDGDGIYDGTERGITTPDPYTEESYGFYVPDEETSSTTDPLDTDTDDDGLNDGTEDNGAGSYAQNGKVDDGETNPEDADTDDDGLLDGSEYEGFENYDDDALINALDGDSDDDSIKDGTERGITIAMAHPHTDTTPGGNFIEDADAGATLTNPLNEDSDSDGRDDGVEDVNSDGMIEGDIGNDGIFEIGWTETSPCLSDSDDDGLWDGNDIGDHKGEIDAGTSAVNPDTDGEGLLDGIEVIGWTITVNGVNKDVTSDPNLQNTDSSGGDTLDDLQEYNAGTDPNLADTDNDNLMDQLEIGFTDPCDEDTDNDELKDGQEDNNPKNGVYDIGGETDPNNDDTDGDDLTDGEEYGITDPLDADSDDDGLLDGDYYEGLDNYDGVDEINALDGDSDNDGIKDGTERGITEATAHDDTDTTPGGNFVEDVDAGATTTNPLNVDSDLDEINDGDEDTDKNGWCNGDTNKDGIWNSDEPWEETNPDNYDTDQDGLWDGNNVIIGEETYEGEETHSCNPLDDDTDNDLLIDGGYYDIGLEEWIVGEVYGWLITVYMDGSEDTFEITSDPTEPHTDEDWIDDGEEYYEGTNPNEKDTDDDNIPDDWEIYWRYKYIDDEDIDIDPCDDRDNSGYRSDPDVDDLSNYNEYLHDTDPGKKDTDGDCLNDGFEVLTGWHYKCNGQSIHVYSDPNEKDTDGDWLFDNEEAEGFEWGNYGKNSTSPNSKDSDCDGISDYKEVNGWYITRWGVDPNEPSKNKAPSTILTASDPTNSHSDSDELDDWLEYCWRTIPGNKDTDGDGLTDKEEIDGWQVNWYGGYTAYPFPTKYHSDDDGLNDYDEKHCSYGSLDPRKYDTDNDCYNDWFEPRNSYSPLNINDCPSDDGDEDQDGFRNGWECSNGYDPVDPNSVPDRENDTDGDGYINGWEIDNNYAPDDPDSKPLDSGDEDGDKYINGLELKYGFSPTDEHDHPLNGGDLDGDTLKNWREINLGTNPDKKDTDGDGVNDDEEVFYGNDPTDSNSCQEKWALLIAPVKDDDEGKFIYNIHETYELLVNNGWDPTHIRALTNTDIVDTYNGEDMTKVNGNNWIYGEPYKHDYKYSMNWLEENSDDDDMIFIVLRDHGGRNPDAIWPLGDERWADGHFCTLDTIFWITDDDLGNDLDDLSYGKLILEVDCCYSGEFIGGGDDCQGDNRLVVTSQIEGLKSYGPVYELYKWLKGDSMYSPGEGYQWEGLNADEYGNNDGRISVEEAHKLITAYCAYEYTEEHGWDHRQLPCKSDNITGEVYLWN